MNGFEEKYMVMLVYDRAIDEEVMDLLSSLELKYYTKIRDVSGVGRNDPHLGDSVWPGLNNLTFIITDEEHKEALMGEVQMLQEQFPSVGLRCFVLQIVESV